MGKGALPIYKATVGLDTRKHPTQATYDPDKGIIGLAKAVNCRVNPAGKLERCHGYSEIFSDGKYHSGFRDGGDAFTMMGKTLYRFNKDETKTGVIGLSGQRVTYAQHGDTTYYSDTVYQGKIVNAVSSAWSKDDYLGPDTSDALHGPPLAKKLAVFGNRMLMVPIDRPKTIIWSEPGQFGLYRRGKAFRTFESEVIMMIPVENGCFASTQHAIYFLDGKDPYSWVKRTKSNYPAIEWSESYERKEGHELGIDTEGEHRCFRSRKGAMAALANGELHNMTENFIDSPTYGQGASIVVGSYYIHSIF